MREMASQARVMKGYLESRVGQRIGTTLPMLLWLVEYAGVLFSKFRVGADGKTPIERLKGRRSHMGLADFGESVMYEVPKCHVRSVKDSKTHVWGVNV